MVSNLVLELVPDRIQRDTLAERIIELLPITVHCYSSLLIGASCCCMQYSPLIFPNRLIAPQIDFPRWQTPTAMPLFKKRVPSTTLCLGFVSLQQSTVCFLVLSRVLDCFVGTYVFGYILHTLCVQVASCLFCCSQTNSYKLGTSSLEI
jgi:hypothetical protein